MIQLPICSEIKKGLFMAGLHDFFNPSFDTVIGCSRGGRVKLYANDHIVYLRNSRGRFLICPFEVTDSGFLFRLDLAERMFSIVLGVRKLKRKNR